MEQILISPKLLPSLFPPSIPSIPLQQKEGQISGKKISRKMNNCADDDDRPLLLRLLPPFSRHSITLFMISCSIDSCYVSRARAKCHVWRRQTTRAVSRLLKQTCRVLISKRGTNERVLGKVGPPHSVTRSPHSPSLPRPNTLVHFIHQDLGGRRQKQNKYARACSLELGARNSCDFPDPAQGISIPSYLACCTTWKRPFS